MKIVILLGVAMGLALAGARAAVSAPLMPNCPDIESYGGSTLSPDNSKALAAALTAAPGEGGCAYMPPGRFTFASAVTVRMRDGAASATLSGAGADVTSLYWPDGGGLTFRFSGPDNSVHVRNLSFTTGAAGKGTALVLDQTASEGGAPADNALSDVSGVTIRGADGYAMTDYWETGVAILRVSNVNITGLDVTGPGGAAYSAHGQGIVLEGNAEAPQVVFNVSGATFNYLRKGILYGDFVQGLTVSQSNFTGDEDGIFVPWGLRNLDQLAVSFSQFNCAHAGVYVGSYLSNTLFSTNLFIVPNTGTGIELSQAYLYSAVGNAFNAGSAAKTAAHPVGIEVGSTAGGGTITGNLFDNMTVAVMLGAGSTGGNVQSNAYSNDTATVRDIGHGNRIGGGSP